jgi:hypothetical protein
MTLIGMMCFHTRTGYYFWRQSRKDEERQFQPLHIIVKTLAYYFFRIPRPPLYMETPEAFVISVDDAGSMVGAATGMPISHENQTLVDPLAGTSYPVAETFYVGKLLFYPAYRNRGLGMALNTGK